MPSTATQAVDLLIEARWVLPMSAGFPVLENHAVAIADGKLQGPWPITDIPASLAARQTLRLDNHALLPGLINAHNHAGMSLMRGYADDLPLMTWLKEHIWPAEAAQVEPGFVGDATRLAMAEMLRSGTTTFADMYLAPEEVAEVAGRGLMRTQLCTPLIDFPTPWARDFDEGLALTQALVERYDRHPTITLAFGPHAPYTVGDTSLARLREAREKLALPIQMHVHETVDEVEQSLASHGKRPLRRLFDAGLLGPHFQAVHMTQIDDEDITILRESRAQVIHCPQSNLKLASGFCPVARLQDAGVNVALGTDGAASNNDLDMFDELRSAALLAKGVSGDAAALPALAALALATRNGARALGLEDRIGQLYEGFEADLVAVDLNDLNTLPIHHPASAIVYALNSRQVSDVWVRGQRRLARGELLDIDLDDLKRRIRGHQGAMTTTGQSGEAS